MRVRVYSNTDWREWLRMSIALFEHPADELVPWMHTHVAREDGTVFVAERDDGSVCGFIEVGERPYADGCDTSPVAYIEALYVDPDMRRRGVARALLAAAEDWARARGRTEVASDTQIGNTVSHRVHTRAGYEEVDRIVQFRKRIG